jgi:hypothetical protein
LNKNAFGEALPILLGVCVVGKFYKIGTIFLTVAVVLLMILHFILRGNATAGQLRLISGLQQLFLSGFMILSAFKDAHQKKERDMSFWLFIILGAVCFVVAIISLQPFF